MFYALLGRSINFPVTESNNGFCFCPVFHSSIRISFGRESVGFLFSIQMASVGNNVNNDSWNAVAVGQLAARECV